MLARTRGFEEGISPIMAVGFADMVGFTMLSQHLSDEELAAVVSRFEELAHDTVVALGGRVVKMIGDEAMFVVHTATNAAEIGLSLAEAYAGDELLSDVRVSLAIGPVLVQDGDYYGPVVNLASRLVGVAHPGTVLISDDLRTALEPRAPPVSPPGPSGCAPCKDIGRVQVWKLSRAGAEPGADRGRNMRWERLGEVVAELEELRERGEKVVHGRLPVPEGEAAADQAPDRELPVRKGARVVHPSSSRAVAIPCACRSNVPSNGATGHRAGRPADRSGPGSPRPWLSIAG